MLKQLIQRLLDSRTTPAEAIHADRINIYTESTFNTDTFVAPRDGFVRVWGKVQDGIAGTALGLNVSTNGGEQGVSRIAFTGSSSDNSIVQTWPVQKGETIRIESFNLDIQLRTFFDAIGGGYKGIVRRDLLCLRVLSNYLPRSSYRANLSGLVSRECRQLRRQLFLQRWTLRGEFMSLQQTGTWFFMAERLNVSCITRLVQALIMGASRVSLEDLSRFGKVAFCTITLKARTALLDSPLLHVSLSKLENGGALC